MTVSTDGDSIDLDPWVSETITQSVTLNHNNIQLASGALVTKTYGGRERISLGNGRHAKLWDDSAADTIQVEDWLLSELNIFQNHELIRSYN